jgi:hypothetical protein
MSGLKNDDGTPWDGESAITNPKYFRYKDPVDGPRIPMTGRVARMHNITYVPMNEDQIIDQENENFQEPDRSNWTYPNEKVKMLDRNVPLFTKQSHFSTVGIRHYIDTPDVLSYTETDNPIPVIVTGKDGKVWIHDGHHRIISSRLRGEQSLKVIDRGVGA